MTAQDIKVDAFLCDAVQESGGKLHAIGIGWNTLGGPQFPLRHGRMAIGLLIHVPYTATNVDHAVRVRIVTEDGAELVLGPAQPGMDPADLDAERQGVVSIGGTFNVGRPPQLTAGDEQVVPLALQLDGIVFPAPGLYAVSISIDGEEHQRLSFRLVHAQPPPGPPT